MQSTIKAKVIAKSRNTFNDSIITTFELEYPRFIHSELMTHRVFSRNAASSRAIPVKKVIEMIRFDPARPVHWGANQSGMQAEKELPYDKKARVADLWFEAAKRACDIAEAMDHQGAHKQIVNRILEPFQMMKTIVTTTELDNFFMLRAHGDAQPEIQELAIKMQKAYNETEAVLLQADEWHTPYYGAGFWSEESSSDSLDDALAISASCCAQVSYRKLDDSLEKAWKIFDRLIASKPIHASPTEHQATPLSGVEYSTHTDREFNLWSGNFRGWAQYRRVANLDHYNEEMAG